MSDYRLDVEVSQENALRNLQLLQARLEQVTAAGNTATQSVSRIGNQSSTASKGLNLLSQTSSNAGVGMMKLEKSSNSLDGSIGILTKSILSYEIAARAISASDAYLSMQNRLKLVTDSERELQTAMNDTFEISQKTGSAWGTNVQIYQRFMEVSDKLGKSQEEIGRVTETIAKSVAMSGATVESANAAMVQFSQGIASGVLRGEEFNSVAEQTPALLDAIARGLNKDRSELRAMAQTGQLTSKLILESLEKSADSTDAMFGRMTLGIGATFNKLRNETTKWVGEMNDASGASSVLVNAMNLLAENLDGAIFIAGTAALASLTKTVIASTTATMTEIAAKNARNAVTVAEMELDAAKAITTARATAATLAATSASVAEAQANVANATSTKALEIAKGVLAVREGQLAAATAANTAATAAEATAVNGLAVATSRLNVAKQAALGLFGGGAGLIAMGVSAAAMYLLMKKNTDESAEAAVAHAKYIDLDREAIEKLNSAQKQNAIDVLTESLRVQNEELKIAQSQYAALINSVANDVRASPYFKDQLQEVNEILTKVRTGVISFEEATDQLNKKNLLTPEQRAQLLDAEQKYQDIYKRANEAATSLKDFGQEAQIAGSKVNNAAIAHNLLNSEVDGTAKAYDKATAAMTKFNDKVIQGIKYNAYVKRRVQDVSLDQAKAEAEYYTQTGKAPSKEIRDNITAELAGKKEIAAMEEKIRAAEREGKKANNKAQKDAEKLQRQEDRERDQRLKDYTSKLREAHTDAEKINYEWSRFMDLYREFGNGDSSSLAKMNAMFDEKLAEAEVALDNYKDQFSSYWNTEADNIDKFYSQQEFLLKNSTKVTVDERKKMQEDLKSSWDNELNLIAIKWEMERLESEKTYKTEKQYLQELLELRLKQIDATPDLTSDQKAIRANAEISSTNSQVQAIDQRTFSDYASVMGSLGTNPIEGLQATLDQQRAIVQEAHTQGVIDKQTYLDSLAMLEQDYYTNAALQQTQLWSSSLDGWMSFFGSIQGETSTAYKALFAMQKGFAMAAAGVNIAKAISDGWASGATIYDKMAAVATIITQTGNIVSSIASITMGFKDGGYTGSIGKNNIAGVVHGNEYVMPAEKTSKYRNTLESMRNGSYEENSGGGNTFNFINNINIGNGEASSTSQADANMMGQALNLMMKKFLENEMGQGGSLYNLVRGLRG